MFQQEQMTFRPIQYISGIKPQPNLSVGGASSFKWTDVLSTAANEEDELSTTVLDVRSFYNSPLGKFLKVVKAGLKVCSSLINMEKSACCSHITLSYRMT